MARLPYPDPAQVYGALHRFPERLHRTNIGRMLSYTPTALVAYYAYSAALVDQLELDPRLRELAILRLTSLAQARQPLVPHAALPRRAGVSEEQITALQSGVVNGELFTCREQAVLALAEEVLCTPRVSDPLFERMRLLFTEREIVELLLVIGWHFAVDLLITTLELEPAPAPAPGDQAQLPLRDQRSRSAPEPMPALTLEEF